jgi:lipopolysaccharide biosynthesis glycosyltransferase
MLDICYYSSDFYAPYTGISILSLCENNKHLDFRVHIVDSGITSENLEKISDVSRQYGREIVFYDFNEITELLKNEYNLPPCAGSYATYIKVFPRFIFKDIDKMLFIDGDTIIRGPLDDIFNLDMDNHLLAAVKVALIYEKSFYKNPDPNSHAYLRFKYSLLFTECGYYNIGICLVNLNKWDEFDFGKHIVATRDKYPDVETTDNIPTDEMMFNLALLYDIGMEYVIPLHPKYNSVIHYMPYPTAVTSSLYCGYQDRKELKEAYFNAVIVHYIVFKPWHKDMFCRYYKDLKKYTTLSPWLQPHHENYFTGIHARLYRKLVYPIPFRWGQRIATLICKLFLLCLSILNKTSIFTKKAAKKMKYMVFRGFLSLGKRCRLFLKGDIKGAFSFPYFLRRRLMRKAKK